MPDLEHTYRFGATPDERCPVCESRDCIQRTYSRKYLEFVKAHQEVYDALYLDGNPGAASNELQRLEREYKTLPPRHACTCWPTHCHECARIGRQRVDAPSAVEIGRSGHRAHAPMPNVTCLDVYGGYARR